MAEQKSFGIVAVLGGVGLAVKACLVAGLHGSGSLIEHSAGTMSREAEGLFASGARSTFHSVESSGIHVGESAAVRDSGSSGVESLFAREVPKVDPAANHGSGFATDSANSTDHGAGFEHPGVSTENHSIPSMEPNLHVESSQGLGTFNVSAASDAGLDRSAKEAGEASKSKFTIVAVSPDSKESFQTVYGATRTYSARTEAEIRAMRVGLSKLPQDLVLLSDQSADKARLVTLFVAAAKDKPVVIVGHSVQIDGARYLVLPSGETISLDEIHHIAVSSGRTCVVVTCKSPDLKLTKDISLDDCLKLCTAASKQVNPGASAGDIATAMQAEYSRGQFHAKIRVAVVGGGITAAAAASVYLDEE